MALSFPPLLSLDGSHVRSVQAGSLMFSLRLPSPDLSVSHASAFHFRSLELPAFKISVAVHALCLFPVQN